jgi:hypothetical protein
MFTTAIEQVSEFTRPLHTIARYWETTDVEPGAATLFFVNDDGWALTCKHVAQVIFAGINARFAKFRAERDALKSKKISRNEIRRIGEKHGFKMGSVVELHSRFMNCVTGKLDLRAELHPKWDVALLKFQNYEKLLCDNFPTFAKDGGELKPGKMICRLGYPFPEFTNFEYDASADRIRWTEAGRANTPRFPIEGMVTRRLVPEGILMGFELSTPGLRGQSGGPAFDTDGRIWGMQSATGHLDLKFDVKMNVVRNGQKLPVRDFAFLHVGHCVHVEVLKDFMRQHNVSFTEN